MSEAVTAQQDPRQRAVDALVALLSKEMGDVVPEWLVKYWRQFLGQCETKEQMLTWLRSQGGGKQEIIAAQVALKGVPDFDMQAEVV